MRPMQRNNGKPEQKNEKARLGSRIPQPGDEAGRRYAVRIGTIRTRAFGNQAVFGLPDSVGSAACAPGNHLRVGPLRDVPAGASLIHGLGRAPGAARPLSLSAVRQPGTPGTLATDGRPRKRGSYQLAHPPLAGVVGPILASCACQQISRSFPVVCATDCDGAGRGDGKTD